MNENIYGHIMETPQKVIRVEVQSDTKNVDGEFSYLINISLLSIGIFLQQKIALNFSIWDHNININSN